MAVSVAHKELTAADLRGAASARSCAASTPGAFWGVPAIRGPTPQRRTRIKGLCRAGP